MESRYQIIQDTAGEGGFGKIDRAWDIELERDVAIKTLDPLFKVSPSPEDKERFRREAKILASLTHPNIPAIYDIRISEEKQELKILFEWIDGVNFRQSLQDRGIMSLEEVRKWFSSICSALDHAHAKGIIHRDIKPSNLIISHGGVACYLVDFGISLIKDDLTRLTQGTPIGTPGYMSPEQESGEELDSSSDIFSLGIVLYECLSGIRPIVGEYRPLNNYNEAIPPAIDNLVRSCIVERDSRIKSANEFFERLNNALRPHASFSKVLSEGALHEIQISLSKMEPEEYASLPKGQHRLVMTRIKDLINVDEFNMRNALASLLSELTRVAYQSEEKKYSYIVKQSLAYGYEKKYGETWMGNIQVRDELNKVAKLCQHNAHKIISEQSLSFIDSIASLENKEKWYFHDLRSLFQNLLANIYCSDEYVENLGDWLDRINELSHGTSIS